MTSSIFFPMTLAVGIAACICGLLLLPARVTALLERIILLGTAAGVIVLPFVTFDVAYPGEKCQFGACAGDVFLLALTRPVVLAPAAHLLFLARRMERRRTVKMPPCSVFKFSGTTRLPPEQEP